ncbi:hypothetical protein BC829DRAFT_214920 [Chytridium lagenaria]|nr:hypothetical protein BC829DRAFT_214920 [Chytridium lagenaria]
MSGVQEKVVTRFWVVCLCLLLCFFPDPDLLPAFIMFLFFFCAECCRRDFFIGMGLFPEVFILILMLLRRGF